MKWIFLFRRTVYLNLKISVDELNARVKSYPHSPGSKTIPYKKLDYLIEQGADKNWMISRDITFGYRENLHAFIEKASWGSVEIPQTNSGQKLKMEMKIHWKALIFFWAFEFFMLITAGSYLVKGRFDNFIFIMFFALMLYFFQLGAFIIASARLIRWLNNEILNPDKT